MLEQQELFDIREAGYTAFTSGDLCPYRRGDAGYTTWWAGYFAAEDDNCDEDGLDPDEYEGEYGEDDIPDSE
jgi:ribosome modulation factor